jgi:hypothetical protein
MKMRIQYVIIYVTYYTVYCICHISMEYVEGLDLSFIIPQRN